MKGPAPMNFSGARWTYELFRALERRDARFNCASVKTFGEQQWTHELL